MSWRDPTETYPTHGVHPYICHTAHKSMDNWRFFILVDWIDKTNQNWYTNLNSQCIAYFWLKNVQELRKSLIKYVFMPRKKCEIIFTSHSLEWNTKKINLWKPGWCTFEGQCLVLPGGQMEENSDKTTPPSTPQLCTGLAWSSDETTGWKWPERSNTYFITEVGTGRARTTCSPSSFVRTRSFGCKWDVVKASTISVLIQNISCFVHFFCYLSFSYPPAKVLH